MYISYVGKQSNIETIGFNLRVKSRHSGQSICILLQFTFPMYYRVVKGAQIRNPSGKHATWVLKTVQKLQASTISSDDEGLGQKDMFKSLQPKNYTGELAFVRRVVLFRLRATFCYTPYESFLVALLLAKNSSHVGG